MEYKEFEMRRSDIYMHSGFGIASFCLAIIANLITWVVVIGGVIVIPEISNSDSGLIIIGLAVIISIFLCLMGIGLGIAGIVIKGRKKVFSILGIIFNILLIVVVSILIIIGRM